MYKRINYKYSLIFYHQQHQKPIKYRNFISHLTKSKRWLSVFLIMTIQDMSLSFSCQEFQRPLSIQRKTLP